ncbi:hypothetical protein DPEC_G00094790 [Dallia pectoralis]|uniref:Uncharacterized protein n=1 Tax=Dallia pectoralis TaxID=75939 RepID=A0ACC2H1D8_DALPE|nr:hypothetical protein DPEC_G00094790 [Dallia pectoralis]
MQRVKEVSSGKTGRSSPNMELDVKMVFVKFWTGRVPDEDVASFLGRFCTILQPVVKPLDRFGICHSEDEELIDEDYTPRTLSTDGDREEESPAPGNIVYQGYPPLPSFSSSPTSSDASAQAGGLKRRLPFPSERTEKKKDEKQTPPMEGKLP